MYITGIGRTKFGSLGKNIAELSYEAIYNAILDSSLAINDIDAIVISNFLGGPLNGQLHLNSLIASILPPLNIPIIRIETACASGSVAMNQAMKWVRELNNVMVVGVEKMTGVQLLPSTQAIAMASDYYNDYKNGLILPASYAIIAQQYMMKYGVSHEILEKVSLINHRNANLNPYAHFYDKHVTEDIIRNSPMIASPLNLYDCSPLSDGAVAVVISNKRQSDRDIKLLGSYVCTDTLSLTQRENLTSFKSTKIAAARIYQDANISPCDIDIIEVHDCFTIGELLALEDLGICKPGESPALVDNGNILINGDIPVNTDGGLKANGHPIGASGLAQIFEIVTQLRLEAGMRQVKDPEIGLAQNIGGVGGTCGITLLGR